MKNYINDLIDKKINNQNNSKEGGLQNPIESFKENSETISNSMEGGKGSRRNKKIANRKTRRIK